jgi:hypothetical protein
MQHDSVYSFEFALGTALAAYPFRPLKGKTELALVSPLGNGGGRAKVFDDHYWADNGIRLFLSLLIQNKNH